MWCCCEAGNGESEVGNGYGATAAPRDLWYHFNFVAQAGG